MALWICLQTEYRKMEEDFRLSMKRPSDSSTKTEACSGILLTRKHISALLYILGRFKVENI
jgi:hypothetical protein